MILKHQCKIGEGDRGSDMDEKQQIANGLWLYNSSLGHSLSLSVIPRLSRYVSLAGPLSVSVSLSVRLFRGISLCFSLSLYVYICMLLSLSVCLCLSV